MKNDFGGLSKTEWSIMNICWKKGKTTAKEIHRESIKETFRTYQAIKAILDKLVDMDFLSREKIGPVFLYEPKVSREPISSNALDDFVKTVFDKAVSPIFLNFVKREKITRKELEELKKIVDDFSEAEENKI